MVSQGPNELKLIVHDNIDAHKIAVIQDDAKNGGHYCDVITGAMASQIVSLKIVYSTVYSDADQRKHQSSASMAFVRGIHRWPVNSPQKWPVTRKTFPFDDVIMRVTKLQISTIFLFMQNDTE